MIVGRLVRRLDARLGFAPLARKGLGKIFPDHWSFMLGELALYSFVVLVATGTYLALFFEPSTRDGIYHGSYAPMNGQRGSVAFVSTVTLSFDVRAGLLIRQVHHWAALVFVAAILVHLMRIFFTGAFRRPRGVNWAVGVTMLTLALLNGFTGYSLPDDLLSGTGLRIAYSVVLSIPLVGEWLTFLLFGGDFPATFTEPRMYIAHVLLVPALLAALIAVHMTILVKQKHSQFPGPGRSEHNVVGSQLWPTYTLRSLGLAGWVLAVLFALGGLFQINPVWIYGPYEPASATSPAQPDWFVAWEEGALRLFPPIEFGVFGHLVPTLFVPGVVLGALTFVVLYAWPLLEARRNPALRGTSHQLLDRPREHPVRLGIGVGALFFYFLLTLAAADDVLARFLRVPVLSILSVVRVLVLTVPWAAGLIAFLLARALRDSGAEGLGGLTGADLRSALRRSAGRPGGQPAAGSSTRDTAVEVWLTRHATWCWRYVERCGGEVRVVLHGNVPELTQDEAVAAAGAAYPDVRVVRVGERDVDEHPPAGERTRNRAADRVLVALWLAAGAVARRRSRRSGP